MTRFRIELKVGGNWTLRRRVEGNYQRLVRVDIGAEAVRIIFDSTWGSETVRLYAFYASFH